MRYQFAEIAARQFFGRDVVEINFADCHELPHHFLDRHGAAAFSRAERRIDYREGGYAFLTADLRIFSAADALAKLLQLLAKHIAPAQRNRLMLGGAAMLNLELAVLVDHIGTAPKIKIHCKVEIGIHAIDVREIGSLGSPI